MLRNLLTTLLTLTLLLPHFAAASAPPAPEPDTTPIPLVILTTTSFDTEEGSIHLWQHTTITFQSAEEVYDGTYAIKAVYTVVNREASNLFPKSVI